MLKEILAISGKPGLYKLVSKGKNVLVIESLSEKKRIPAYARDKVISLGEIAVYTDTEEVPVGEVFTAIKEKENGGNPSIDLRKAEPDDLRTYFAEILPGFDRERVYPTDIKKMLKWYEILTAEGLTDFSAKDDEEKKESEAKTNPEKKEVKNTAGKKASKNTAPANKAKTKGPAGTAAPKKNVVGAKRGG